MLTASGGRTLRGVLRGVRSNTVGMGVGGAGGAAGGHRFLNHRAILRARALSGSSALGDGLGLPLRSSKTGLQFRDRDG